MMKYGVTKKGRRRIKVRPLYGYRILLKEGRSYVATSKKDEVNLYITLGLSGVEITREQAQEFGGLLNHYSSVGRLPDYKPDFAV